MFSFKPFCSIPFINRGRNLFLHVAIITVLYMASKYIWSSPFIRGSSMACYLLQKAIENGHRNSWFTHWKWWFSIVMLVLPEGTCCQFGYRLRSQLHLPVEVVFWNRKSAQNWSQIKTTSFSSDFLISVCLRGMAGKVASAQAKHGLSWLNSGSMVIVTGFPLISLAMAQKCALRSAVLDLTWIGD